jgi:hypothetical protein
MLLFIRVITFALNTLKMLLFHHEALLLLRAGDDGEAWNPKAWGAKAMREGR